MRVCHLVGVSVLVVGIFGCKKPVRPIDAIDATSGDASSHSPQDGGHTPPQAAIPRFTTDLYSACLLSSGGDMACGKPEPLRSRMVLKSPLVLQPVPKTADVIATVVIRPNQAARNGGRPRAARRR